MMKMFQIYPRMPGPAATAMQHMFASAFAAVVFPYPATLEWDTDVRESEQDAAISLPHLNLAIVAAPVGDASDAMQRQAFANCLTLDLLTVDLGRGCRLVEAAVEYGSAANRGRVPEPASALWLGNSGVFLVPLERSHATLAVQLTAHGLVSAPLPFATDTEWLAGAAAASFCAKHARAAQCAADTSAPVRVSIV